MTAEWGLALDEDAAGSSPTAIGTPGPTLLVALVLAIYEAAGLGEGRF